MFKRYFDTLFILTNGTSLNICRLRMGKEGKKGKGRRQEEAKETRRRKEDKRKGMRHGALAPQIKI